MKNIIILSILTALVAIAIVSCKKDIELSQDKIAMLVPVNEDANAGTWKPIVIGAPADVTIAAPFDASSPEYIAEVADVKSKSSNLTNQQKESVAYWAAGGTIRWNQILRELVSKYNLPPEANADGSYPVPDATKPFDYPAFPFSNPPYASRAYACVAVAQYDALVATYYYKNQFNRSSPYKVDPTITTSANKGQLSSFPSEDAAIASASFEMLKALFPAELDYLTRKFEEHKNSRIWAGVNTASDITAGASLGQQVGAKVIARAKTDGMKNSLGNTAKWDSLAAAQPNVGNLPWKSLENPVRPPMLPFFGNVKSWLTDKAGLLSIRPSAPPKTDSEDIKKQLAEVKSYTQARDRDKIAIVHIWADGAGTYTPSGHWNYIATDFIINAKFSEVRAARAYALLNMALADAAISCWDTKTYYYYPRPSQLDPTIKTLTGLPNFPSYTSGHSTFSGAAARVLGYLFPNEKSKVDAQALEASNSRIYGGLHYRMDCEKGLEAGNKIGDFAILRATSDGAQ